MCMGLQHCWCILARALGSQSKGNTSVYTVIAQHATHVSLLALCCCRVLASVAPNLQQLELGWPGPLEVGSWFAALPKLTRALLDARQLQLMPAVAGCLSLRHVAMSLPGRGPGLSFQGPQACLPPGLESLSLFGAGLKSLPMVQLAQLQGLISLDLSCNPRLRPEDFEACLTSLTTLRELGLSSCSLLSLPHQLSLLAELRVLYLHQAFAQEWAAAGPAAVAAEFEAALGPLRRLAMLSISGCGLTEVPPAVAALASLRALHLEDNSLQLCPGPYLAGLWVSEGCSAWAGSSVLALRSVDCMPLLAAWSSSASDWSEGTRAMPALPSDRHRSAWPLLNPLPQELCIDWNTLFTSHTLLRSQGPPHLSKLLLNGSQHTLGEDGAANPPVAVAASLAACPRLVQLVDVLPEGSGGQLDFEVAQLMCLLPSAYPRLHMVVTIDDDFGYSLATLPPEWGLG